MQDQDPHHMHSSGWEIYIYLFLAPVLVGLLIYGGAKLMTYWDNRKKRAGDDSARNEE